LVLRPPGVQCIGVPAGPDGWERAAGPDRYFGHDVVATLAPPRRHGTRGLVMTTPTAGRAAAGVLLILIAGCGETTSRPKVKGKVTYNGQPLANKTLILTLEGAQGVSQSLPLGPDGSFDGEVPQPGTYRVSIAESLAVMEGFDRKRKD